MSLQIDSLISKNFSSLSGENVVLKDWAISELSSIITETGTSKLEYASYTTLIKMINDIANPNKGGELDHNLKNISDCIKTLPSFNNYKSKFITLRLILSNKEEILRTKISVIAKESRLHTFPDPFDLSAGILRKYRTYSSHLNEVIFKMIQEYKFEFTKLDTMVRRSKSFENKGKRSTQADPKRNLVLLTNEDLVKDVYSINKSIISALEIYYKGLEKQTVNFDNIDQVSELRNSLYVYTKTVNMISKVCKYALDKLMHVGGDYEEEHIERKKVLDDFSELLFSTLKKHGVYKKGKPHEKTELEKILQGIIQISKEIVETFINEHPKFDFLYDGIRPIQKLLLAVFAHRQNKEDFVSFLVCFLEQPEMVKQEITKALHMQSFMKTDIGDPAPLICALKEIADLGTDHLQQLKSEFNAIEQGQQTAFDNLWESFSQQFIVPARSKKKPHKLSKGQESDKARDEIDSDEDVPSPAISLEAASEARQTTISAFIERIEDITEPTTLLRETMQLLFPVIEKKVFSLKGFEGSAEIIQEISSHLFLASCGLEQLIIDLNKGSWKSLEVIYPMLLIDWHVQLEQVMTAKLYSKTNEEPKSHSLVNLFKQCDSWESLPLDQKNFLEAIDWALIWSRYPMSSKHRCNPQNIPQGLKWLITGAESSYPCTQSQAEELTHFIFKCQHHCLKLLLTGLGIPPSDEILQLVDLFKPDGQIAKKILFAEQIQPEVNIQEPHSLIQEIAEFKNQNSRTGILAGALSDVQYHLNRIQTSLKMSLTAVNHLKSWHARNLMNLQWVFENLFAVQLYLQENQILYFHDFRQYQTLLDNNWEGSAVAYDVQDIMKWNYGIGIHYPWKLKRDHDSLIPFIKAMEHDRKHYGLADGYIPGNSKKSKKNASGQFLHSLQERIVYGMTQASIFFRTEIAQF